MALQRTLKEARDRDGGAPTLVSQSVVGQQGTVFYITQLRPSLAAFDEIKPLPQVLGEDGFQRYLKASAETVLYSETNISRFVPELSNPPEGVVSAAPDFWRPKPPAAAKPKKSAEAAKAQ